MLYLSLYIYIYFSANNGYNYLVTKVSFACIVARFIVLQFSSRRTQSEARQLSNGLEIGAAEVGGAGVLRVGVGVDVFISNYPITNTKNSEGFLVSVLQESKVQLDGLFSSLD